MTPHPQAVEETSSTSAAASAAADAWERVRRCLEERRHFLLEAGAGAGKTYSLIQALQYVIAAKGDALMRRKSQVACITYTNVATREIETRTDSHPAVYAATIHSFCWELIRPFQREMRRCLGEQEAWTGRFAEAGGLANQTVEYSLGYPRVSPVAISLGHNDVVRIASQLLSHSKFIRIIASRFPVIFVDEYQDTDREFVEALKSHVLSDSLGPQIGFFGDHLQKIYPSGCGAIEHKTLEVIGKGANFRSSPAVVEVLNRIRPELTQVPQREAAQGTVAAFHCNNWVGTRRTGSHWAGDVPAAAAHQYLEMVKARLADQGWVFGGKRGKILMLTHNVLAAEQGYANLAGAFSGHTDAFVRREDPHIEFLLDSLEPALSAFQRGKIGAMFEHLRGGLPTRISPEEKVRWYSHLTSLLELRTFGTIGDVMDAVRSARLLGIPSVVLEREALAIAAEDAVDESKKDLRERVRSVRAVPYRELTALQTFLDAETPFSTKHGVKGAEFDDVLVVFGRGWNQYNFAQFLELAPRAVPDGKKDFFERNRNLFYVACSRPRSRLALLFTQQLSEEALATLSDWIGQQNVHALPSQD